MPIMPIVSVLLTLLSANLFAQNFSPVPASDQPNIDRNFHSIVDEQARQDLTQGGTIQSNVVVTTVTIRGQIILADGSILTTSPTSYASTRTFIQSNTTALSNAAINIGIAGSTVTLVTTHTARHQFILSATIRQGNAGDHVQCGVLQDGGYIDGQTSAIGIWTGHGQGTPGFYNLGSTWTTQSTYAAGSYAYTIVCGIDGNSFQFCSSALAAGTSRCMFEVRELAY